MMRSANFIKGKHSLGIGNIFHRLFPFGNAGIISLEETVSSIQFVITSKSKLCKCPYCKRGSKHVHSYYERHLTDLPILGKHVTLIFKARRMKCKNPKCSCKVFCERSEALTSPYSRKTNRLASTLEKLLIEVSSIKGAYIANETLQVKLSSSTCLRLVHGIQTVDVVSLETVGIDDWAYKKGQTYGSIIIDLQTGRPVDLLKSRDGNDVSSWFKTHPAIEIVTRDRASGYAKAIVQGAPQALQIADKFHLLVNLSEHITHEISTAYHNIREEVANTNVSLPTITDKEVYITPSIRIKYETIHKLLERGLSMNEIQKITKYSEGTIRKYKEMKQLTPCRGTPPPSPYNYIKYLDDIRQGFAQGMNRLQVYNIICSKGYKGHYNTFVRWVRKRCDSSSKGCWKYIEYHGETTNEKTAQEKLLRINKLLHSRKLAIFVCNQTYGVNRKTGECSREHEVAESLIHSSSILTDLREIYSSFKEVINGSNPKLLENWITKYESSEHISVKKFIKGIKFDMEPVMNAISYPWTNGIVEGHVNRLKSKKREMYGRASFNLLRKKVLLSRFG